MKEYITPNEEALFGANDSETIQNAIAAAEKDGCRKIVIPRYNARTDSTEWRIPEAIMLPSDFTVILDNCYMVQETGVFQNMFCNSYAWDESKYDIEHEQHDISIIGVGNVVLDGGKHNRCREKTNCHYGLPTIWVNNMILWVNCRNIRVENINIQHQRWWAVNHIFCRDVVCKNIHFYAIPHVSNMDGIDLRVGCNNFVIENITGRTGDDTVALTALSDKGALHRMVKGKENDTHIHDVKMKNIKSDPEHCFIVRLLNHDGHKEYNIDIDTIMDTSDYVSKMRSGSALGMGAPIYFHERPREKGEFYNITAKNIYSRSNNTFFISQAFEHSKISNVHTFGDNINLLNHGLGGPYTGCFFDDVLFEHIFYGADQTEICLSNELPAENYNGKVLDLSKMTGELKIKDLNIDRVKKGIILSGGMTVKIDGYKCNRAFEEFTVAEDSKLIIDGEEIK